MYINNLQILFLSLLVMNAAAESFELRKNETKAGYSFIELQYGSEKGKSMSEILKHIQIEKDALAIRFLGSFSKATNNELMSFYKDEIPDELELALKSSGNLHNPTLEPLVKNFRAAFRTTRLYKNIERELVNHGYSITHISFEKYIIKTKSIPHINVSDIWLKFSKIPNKSVRAHSVKNTPHGLNQR